MERDRHLRAGDDLARRRRARPSCCRRRRAGARTGRIACATRWRARPASPNRVRESVPPEIRSSPVTVGPSFWRLTAIPNHEPARTWPCRRTCASIFSPSAAKRGGRPGPAAHTATSDAAASRRAMRPGAGRLGRVKRAPGPTAGETVGASTCQPPEKLHLDDFALAHRPLPVAVGRGLSYDASAPDPSVSPAQSRGARRCPVIAQRDPLPEIRPFRALRFDPEIVGGLGPIVAPPYDVIGEELRGSLLARSPRNAVRLDLPFGEPGEDPDERYRRVARTFAAWRSDGALRKDPKPAVYVYEQVYAVPGTDDRAHPARLLRPTEARAVRARGRASSRTSARSPLRARTATGCCARPASTRRPSWSCTRIPRARPRRTSRRSPRPRRRSISPTTTACAIVCGS